MGAEDLAVCDHGFRCYLSVSVDNDVVANGDPTETKVAIAFDAETTNERLVDLAVVPNIKQVVLAKSREFAHLHVLADSGAKELHVNSFKGWMHSEDTTSGDEESLVDNPPTQVIRRPHGIYAGFVEANDEPLEDNSHDRCENKGSTPCYQNSEKQGSCTWPERCVDESVHVGKDEEDKGPCNVRQFQSVS